MHADFFPFGEIFNLELNRVVGGGGGKNPLKPHTTSHAPPHTLFDFAFSQTYLQGERHYFDQDNDAREDVFECDLHNYSTCKRGKFSHPSHFLPHKYIHPHTHAYTTTDDTIEAAKPANGIDNRPRRLRSEYV